MKEIIKNYCKNCKFGIEQPVFTQIICKRFPNWEYVNREHWCFEFVERPIKTDYQVRINDALTEKED